VVFRPRPKALKFDSSRKDGQFIAAHVTFLPFVASIVIWVAQWLIDQSIDTSEVHKMNTNLNAHLIMKTTLILGAVAAMTFPLMISANVNANSNAGYSLVNTVKPAEPRNDPEAVYVKLQNLSQDVCGSSDLRITGSLKKSAEVETCYEGTLSAAVDRLDRPAVTQLHQN
jgi:hypothetical protein